LSLKNPSYPTGNPNCDLAACKAVPQPPRIAGIRSFGLLEIQAKSLISEDTMYMLQSPGDQRHLSETGSRMMTDAICQIQVSHTRDENIHTCSGFLTFNAIFYTVKV
jgi:hypothetical protein